MKLSLSTFWHAITFAMVFISSSAHAEDAKTYQLVYGRTVTPLDVFRECDDCPEMIVMPLGSFMMGAKPEDSRNPFDFYGDDATGLCRKVLSIPA